jgi:hypothetical protein
MRAMLNVEAILDNMPSEEHLLDVSHMDSIYAIRKLTAAARAAHYQQALILGEANESGQRYSEVYQIWFNKEEFMEI